MLVGSASEDTDDGEKPEATA